MGIPPKRRYYRYTLAGEGIVIIDIFALAVMQAGKFWPVVAGIGLLAMARWGYRTCKRWNQE
jgi:hypothetical protein